MPEYQTFPTLTDEAIIRHGAFKYQRPNVRSEYEAGPEEVRLTTSEGRYNDMQVSMTLRADTDYQTVMGFLEDRGLEAEPFYYTHPWLGTALVRFNASEIKIEPAINGNPPWFHVELILRGQWNA